MDFYVIRQKSYSVSYSHQYILYSIIIVIFIFNGFFFISNIRLKHIV